MNPREIEQYFKKREGEIVDKIREIVEIESPSCDVARSRLIADWIETEAGLTGTDLQIERVPAKDFGEHVLMRAFPGAEKNILVLGHTDTVHPVGTNLLNPTRIENGKFFGCGIFDMKSGIVLMLEALRFFAASDSRPSRPITILLSCDEEVGSATGREIVEAEARNAERCLVIEPSSAGAVKTARKGTGMFTVKTWGIPAHAGLEPEKGASAILELSRQIQMLHDLTDYAVGTTVNVCTIKGGTTTNVMPEHAECSVDVRFTSVAEASRVERAIGDLRAFDERVRVLISGGINRPPLERTTAVAGLFEQSKQIASEFDYPLGETQVGGASDGNFVGALGIPVLDGLGIAGDGAHRTDEHILIDDIVKRATLLTSLLLAPIPEA
jgi:glutamate carboxypeptidase